MSIEENEVVGNILVGYVSGYAWLSGRILALLFLGIQEKFTDVCSGLQKDAQLDIDKNFNGKFCCFFVLTIDACVKKMVFGAGGAVLPMEPLGMVFLLVLNLCEVSGHGKEGYT